MNGPLFIHSSVDDYGLTPQQFRVLCHVARREVCFASALSIGRVCGLHRDTVFRCLKHLVGCKILSPETHQGQTTTYRIAPMAQWNPPVSKGLVNDMNPPETKGRGRRKVRDGGSSEVRDTHPPVSKGHKGSPSEVTPLNGSPSKGEGAPIRSVLDGKDVEAACNARMTALKNDPGLRGDDGKFTPEAQAEWDALVDRKREAIAVQTGARPTKKQAEQMPKPKGVDRNAGTANERGKSDYTGIGCVRTVEIAARKDLWPHVVGENHPKPTYFIGTEPVTKEQYEAGLIEWNKRKQHDERNRIREAQCEPAILYVKTL